MNFQDYKVNIEYEATQEYMTQIIAALEYQKRLAPESISKIDTAIDQLFSLKKTLQISVEEIKNINLFLTKKAQQWQVLQKV